MSATTSLDVRVDGDRVLFRACGREQTGCFRVFVTPRPTEGASFRIEVDAASRERCLKAGFEIVEPGRLSEPEKITKTASHLFRIRFTPPPSPSPTPTTAETTAPPLAARMWQTTRSAVRTTIRSAFGPPKPPSAVTHELRLCVSDQDGKTCDVNVALIVSETWASISQMLRDEYDELSKDGTPGWSTDEADTALQRYYEEKDKLGALFDLVHRSEQGLSALCLSGGGIRSATFNLGVLQALARRGLLERFDYLSSVSGGGYIASWLSAWIHKHEDGAKGVIAELQGRPICPVDPATAAGNLETSPGADATSIDDRAHCPRDPEPRTVRHLRRFSNYLTPKLGIFSADTWTLGAIYARNLVLNWLVFVPLLAAVLAIPLVAAVAARNPVDPRWWFGVALFAKCSALFSMNVLRANVTLPASRSWALRGEQGFLFLGLVPLFIAVVGVLGAVRSFARDPVPFSSAFKYAVIWSVIVPLLALASSKLLQMRWKRERTHFLGDAVGVALAGAVIAAIYAGMLTAPWLARIVRDAERLAVLGPALVLGPFLLGKTLFVGLVSVTERTARPSAHADAEREWWARWSAWIAIALIAWTALSFLAIYGPKYLDTGFEQLATLIGGLGFGGVAAWLGKSVLTPAMAGGQSSTARKAIMAIAAPAFCVLIAVAVAAGTQDLLPSVTAWLERGLPAEAYLGAGGERVVVYAIVCAALLFFGLIMGWFININRFSLQAMYRNRLVRAYLGASNVERRPSLFTGFDPEDNLNMVDLRSNRPLPVINLACNLVGGDNLAWQERRASSFTVTPLHCGTYQLGYRSTHCYGGFNNGISVGTAVATSGAAANPNMGYNSSPPLAFIMTMFNARLGAWLGNPGPDGEKTYHLSAPSNSALPLFAEAFGFTDDRHPYVCLSDGGHFDNLGLYEMVMRRVRNILVCDAGCDPEGAFDDLGAAIRKIRIDFGIPIHFEERIRIPSRKTTLPIARYCAIATIRYREVDGDDAPDGKIIYIKPALLGDEPYDVFNYGRASEAFPHESTADQWFSESQFESYRTLGRATVETMCSSDVTTFREFYDQVRKYLATPQPHQPMPWRVPTPAREPRTTLPRGRRTNGARADERRR